MSSERDDPAVDALLTVGVTGAVTGAFGSAAPGTAGAPRIPSPASRRFEPGAIIAGRYRLVALLGRGGMGEVYRADDLTLDQPVALKFLPLAVGGDERSLARFHNELRVARQVSHRNVCRLYDVGEADGHRFLTMEYIDGEDLGSLLRRIGRLPQDKAIQTARQLCAGVAAAHERGVLHRDLKPANVMIDGQGDARITDFGIATVASAGAQELAGTPQYMAPELFAGQPASVQSDIYALGLTLYELFTGKRAYDGQTLVEVRRLHETGTIATPSTLVRELDPAVERVILRCLDKDPTRRPATALTVAAMLPGGDALADALAAGETPSPELLSAAGEREALPVWRGAGAVALVVVGALVFAALSGRLSVFGRTPHELAPAVLVDRAKAVVRAAGYADGAADEAYELMAASAYVNWMRLRTQSPDRLDILSNGRPSGVNFWYRSSPREMIALGGDTPDIDDPPMVFTDMRLVVLDAAGRLQEFRSVPAQRESVDPDSVDEAVDGAAPPPDWAPMFAAAALDPAVFSAVAPRWTPRDYADARFAWEGPLPGVDGRRLRIEAGSYRGRPVSFALIAPWTQPTLMVERPTERIDRIFIVLAVALFSLVAVAAVVLARHNVSQARADRRGAARVALTLALVLLLSWMAVALSEAITTIEAHFRAAGIAALYGLMVWGLYLALEPYARKFWPQSLLGWSRLLSGHVRDPRVGRDVLSGLLLGVVLAYLDLLRSVIMPALGFAAPQPIFGTSLALLLGPAAFTSGLMGWIFSALLGALVTMLGLVLAKLLLRRAWLTIPVASLVLAVSGANLMGTSSLWMLLFPLAQGVALVAGTVWLGLLPLVVARLIWYALDRVPFTSDLSGWAAMPSNASIALIVALAVFAFYASRAGQPLFGRVLKE